MSNSFRPEPHEAVRTGARIATDQLDVVAIARVKGMLGLDSGGTHTVPVVVRTWPIAVKDGRVADTTTAPIHGNMAELSAFH